MGWLDALFGKGTSKNIKTAQKVLKAAKKVTAPAPPPPETIGRVPTNSRPKVIWGKSANGNDQTKIDGYLVTVFKKGDLWNYCVAEILDEEETASGEKPDLEFGDEYPTKAEAKREALIYIGVF